jgi:hypothetical protein
MKHVLLLGVPAVMLAVGGMTLAAWLLSRLRSLTAMAVVTGFKVSVDDEGRPVYRAIFSLSVDGREIEAVDSFGMGWRPFRVGQWVKVQFPPGEPDKACIARWWLPLAYIGVMTAGGVVLALGVSRL